MDISSNPRLSDTVFLCAPCFRKSPFPFNFFNYWKNMLSSDGAHFMSGKLECLVEFLRTSSHCEGPPQMKQPGCNVRKGANAKDEIELKTQEFLSICIWPEHNKVSWGRDFLPQQGKGPAHGPAPHQHQFPYIYILKGNPSLTFKAHT